MSEAPARKQLKNTMYDQMEFPEYEFREFPMEVPYVDGQVMPTPYNEKHKPHPTVRVNSQEELDALTAGEVEVIPAGPDTTAARVRTEDDERAELLLKADQNDIKVDKRWSLERLRLAVNGPEIV